MRATSVSRRAFEAVVARASGPALCDMLDDRHFAMTSETTRATRTEQSSDEESTASPQSDS